MTHDDKKKSSSCFELLCDGGNVLSLVESLSQLDLGGLSGAVSSKGSRTIGATTLNLLHLKHTSSKCVSDGDKDHAVMSELGNSCQAA